MKKETNNQVNIIDNLQSQSGGSPGGSIGMLGDYETIYPYYPRYSWVDEYGVTHNSHKYPHDMKNKVSKKRK